MDAESFCFADGLMQLLWRPSDACMHFQWLCRSFKVRVREKDRLIEAAEVPTASRVLQVLNHPSHLEIAPGEPPSRAEELLGRSENYPQGTTSYCLFWPILREVPTRRELTARTLWEIFQSRGISKYLRAEPGWKGGLEIQKDLESFLIWSWIHGDISSCGKFDIEAIILNVFIPFWFQFSSIWLYCYLSENIFKNLILIFLPARMENCGYFPGPVSVLNG